MMPHDGRDCCGFTKVKLPPADAACALVSLLLYVTLYSPFIQTGTADETLQYYRLMRFDGPYDVRILMYSGRFSHLRDDGWKNDPSIRLYCFLRMYVVLMGYIVPCVCSHGRNLTYWCTNGTRYGWGQDRCFRACAWVSSCNGCERPLKGLLTPASGKTD